MTTFIVGCNLRKSGRNYADLYEALKGYPMWWHHLDSLWIVVTNKTAIQVRDHLRQYIDVNDRLLVMRCEREAAWTGFEENGSDWLMENL
ncbi:hypothetical protein [Cupriavidus necator]|uniref:hypothetical protein n=1 Tax=Cupriavidus necator TaxID=106590 RepID=UPI0039C3328C